MFDFRHYIDLITEAQHDALVDAIIRQFPDQEKEIRDHATWASQVLKKADRINWYLGKLRAYLSDQLTPEVLGDYQFTTMQQLQHDLAHFYGYNSPAIEAYQYQRQPIGDLIRDLEHLESEWTAKQTQERGVDPQEGDYVLFEFPGGIKWWWINRAYCSEEGRSGRHCGNVVGKNKTNQRILSLRDNRNRVILTFIREPNGTLGEMKAKGNQKPQEQYHPHIMKLLLWDKIKGISGEGHLPDMNFSVFDLNEEYLNELNQQKPKLIVDQIKITPIDFLRAPDFIKQNQKYFKYATSKLPSIKSLIIDNSLENWIKIINKNKKMMVYLPVEYYNSFPDFKNQLLNYLAPIGSESYFSIEDNPASNLPKLPKIIRQDFSFVQKIIQRNPLGIAYVNTNIKGYQELVNIAVTQNITSLILVPDENKTEELCKFAFNKDVRALFSIPEPIKLKYPKWSEIAVSKDGDTLRAVPDQLKTKELCELAVSTYGPAIEHVPESIKLNYPKIYEIAVKNDGMVLDYIPDEIKLKYPNLNEIAVSHDGYALGAVPDQLKTKTLCELAVTNNGLALQFVPNEVKLKYPSLIKIAASQNGLALLYVSDETIAKYPSLVKIAVSSNPYIIQDLSEKFKTEEICTLALQKSHDLNRGYIMTFVPEELQPKLAKLFNIQFIK